MTKRARFMGMMMVAALPAAAQFLYPHDPSPFRRDSLEGRDFTFDNLTFLHRLKTGARLTLALTTRLHRVGFGGGNVQLVLPF